MKKVIAFILLISISLSGIFAVTHLSVPLGDRVYEILRSAELRGIIDQVGTVKPYSRSIVVKNLETILQNPEIKASERMEIIQVLQRFDNSFTSPKNINDALALGGYQSYWDEYKTGVVFGVEAGTTMTKSLTIKDSYDARIRLRPLCVAISPISFPSRWTSVWFLTVLTADCFLRTIFRLTPMGSTILFFPTANKYHFIMVNSTSRSFTLSFLDGIFSCAGERWPGIGGRPKQLDDRGIRPAVSGSRPRSSSRRG